MNVVAQKYRLLSKKGEGTFSEVLKCQSKQDGTYWACKKMKQRYDSIDQVNNLREIQALRRLTDHANVLHLEEVIFDKKSGVLVLVCELMDMNIYELIRGKRHYLPEKRVKSYMFQLLKSIDHMHRNGIFHRDVKPENILIRDDLLKLADFGSCRSIYSKPPFTEYISTRWYRAPECLLTDGHYSYKMDMWSVGCVFFEILSLHPLFPGANEVDQINKIHDILGTPDPKLLEKLKHKTRGIDFNFPSKKGTGLQKLLPHSSHQCVELIYRMCEYDPTDRISAKAALRHGYFREIRDLEKKRRMEAEVFESNKMAEETTTSENPMKKEHSDVKVGDVKVNVHGGAAAKDRKKKKAMQKLRDDQHRLPHHQAAAAATDSLPKVPQSKLSFSTATFPDHSFPKTFPKLQSTSLLPPISDTFKKSKPSRNYYSQYQLPSLEKRA